MTRRGVRSQAFYSPGGAAIFSLLAFCRGQRGIVMPAQCFRAPIGRLVRVYRTMRRPAILHAQ